MRNILKAATIESKFPLLAVEHGCIVSKDADITVAYRVELPELFTVTSAEYEAIHAAWCKAVKVLPEYSIVHKQDWFIREQYRPQTGDAQMSFLSRSFERHFNERPYLNHSCFLFLTKTTKERMRMQSNFSTLCRGNIIPKEVDRESTTKFLEAVDQFERILNDSGFISITRLSGDEITGTKEQPGLLEKYFTLSLSDTTSLQDVELGAETLRVGNKRVCLHTLSDTEDLPGHVGTDMRYERLSTDRSDCLLSFAAPVGLLLSCDHIYNQYLFLESSDANLQMFEKRARNMQSLSRYSRSNQINKEWIDRYLNEAHSFGLLSIRAHFNVMAWSDDAEELRRIRKTWAASSRSWSAARATTPWMPRRSFGRVCRVMRATSLPKNRSTRSSNRRCASSRRRPTTSPPLARLASRCATVSAGSRCIWTSRTSR